MEKVVTVEVEKLVKVPVPLEVEKLIEVEKLVEVIVPVTVEIERHVVVDPEVGKERRDLVPPVLEEYQDFNWSLDTDRWLMLGTAEHLVSEGTVQLTDAHNHQLGVLLNRKSVRWGDSTIRFSFGISGGPGADGLALLLLTSLPDFDLSADRTKYPAGGYWVSHLLEGYLVAFDTYRNPKGFWREWYYSVDDPSSNFVALAKVNAGRSQELMSHLATADLPLDLRSSGVFEADMEIRDEGVVDVYLTNSEAGMDRTLVMRSSIRDFPGDRVYLGFVARTGDFDDRHVIHSVRYESE